MKILKAILVIVIILGLAFGGYKGYLAYQNWQQVEKSQDQLLIESLKANEGMVVELTTELAKIKKKVISDTLKETIVIKEEAPTYESTKEELIELRKDPEVNAEKIEIARIELEKRMDEFQESPDKILINMGEEKIVIYEDGEGNLVSLESGITITRHKDVSDIPIPIEEKELEATDWDFKFGGYYDLTEKDYGLMLSKEIFSIKSYNLNVSLLSDLKSLEGFNLGANINYSLKSDLEFGVGITIDKTYFMCLEYSF